MTQATGSAGQILIVEEIIWGVTPTTPAMVRLSSSLYGESLTSSSEELVSNAINPNRGVLATRNSQLTVSGSVPFELPIQNAELIFKGLMGSGVTTGVGPYTHTFKRAATLPSFSIEKGFTDISQYFTYKGCKIGALQLAVEPNGLVAGSFEVQGKQTTVASTSSDASPTIYNHNVFAGIDGVVLEGGAGAQFLSFNLNITNGLYNARVIGSKYTENIGAGKGECTGDLTVMFEDLGIYNKWLNETQTNIRLTFVQGTSSTEFYFPKIKFNGEGAPKIDTAEGIVITLNWRALVDDAEDSDVVITVINDKATI